MSYDETSVRGWVAARLAELLPDSWRIIPEQRTPETINEPTVIIKHSRITRLAQAPKGNLEHELIVTIASNHTDQSPAEDQLDDTVVKLITSLDQIINLNWTGAEKVQIHPERAYIGWDLTVTVLTEKD